MVCNAVSRRYPRPRAWCVTGVRQGASTRRSSRWPRRPRAAQSRRPATSPGRSRERFSRRPANIPRVRTPATNRGHLQHSRRRLLRLASAIRQPPRVRPPRPRLTALLPPMRYNRGFWVHAPQRPFRVIGRLRDAGASPGRGVGRSVHFTSVTWAVARYKRPKLATDHGPGPAQHTCAGGARPGLGGRSGRDSRPSPFRDNDLGTIALPFPSHRYIVDLTT